MKYQIALTIVVLATLLGQTYATYPGSCYHRCTDEDGYCGGYTYSPCATYSWQCNNCWVVDTYYSYCGDYSECDFPVWAIIVICVGGLIVFGVIAFVCYRKRKQNEDERRQIQQNYLLQQQGEQNNQPTATIAFNGQPQVQPNQFVQQQYGQPVYQAPQQQQPVAVGVPYNPMNNQQTQQPQSSQQTQQ